MAFKTVLRIPESLLKGKEGSKFLEKKDLKNLIEHNLLYFLRTSQYHILHDYPCMGAFEKRLRYSIVDGPYEIVPKTEKQDVYSESTREILEVLVPKDKMPVNLEKVSLIDYGTQTDNNSLRHAAVLAGGKCYQDHIWEIGIDALKKLHKIGAKVKTISDSVLTCMATVDDCILELHLAKTRFYPEIGIIIFGINYKPRELVQELGLHRLRDRFPTWDRDIVIRDSIRTGFAYNLSLKGETVSDIKRLENIIL